MSDPIANKRFAANALRTLARMFRSQGDENGAREFEFVAAQLDAEADAEVGQ